MHMSSLVELHRSMRAMGVVLQRFEVQTGATVFECLFSVCDDPFRLALTSRGADPRFILLNVERGYRIADLLEGDNFRALCAALRVHGLNGERISTTAWLRQLNDAIPKVARPENLPQRADIARLRRDLEEGDRLSFLSWRQHPLTGRTSGPSLRNLEKTSLLLGPEARAFAGRHRLSSCWTIGEADDDWRRLGRRYSTS